MDMEIKVTKKKEKVAERIGKEQSEKTKINKEALKESVKKREHGKYEGSTGKKEKK